MPILLLLDLLVKQIRLCDTSPAPYGEGHSGGGEGSLGKAITSGEDPSIILGLLSGEEFEDYMEELFRIIAPEMPSSWR